MLEIPSQNGSWSPVCSRSIPTGTTRLLRCLQALEVLSAAERGSLGRLSNLRCLLPQHMTSSRSTDPYGAALHADASESTPLKRPIPEYRQSVRRSSRQSLDSIPELSESPSRSPYNSQSFSSRCFYLVLRFHTSKFGHICVLTLVAIDVLIVLAELILALLTCKAPTKTSEAIEETLSICSITISTVFVLELFSTIMVLGIEYLTEWVHALDAIIILASFTLDLTARGATEEIGSLLIIGRLWRIVKLAGEATVVDSERTEGLEREIEVLKKENESLKTR